MNLRVVRPLLLLLFFTTQMHVQKAIDPDNLNQNTALEATQKTKENYFLKDSKEIAEKKRTARAILDVIKVNFIDRGLPIEIVIIENNFPPPPMPVIPGRPELSPMMSENYFDLVGFIFDAWQSEKVENLALVTIVKKKLMGGPLHEARTPSLYFVDSFGLPMFLNTILIPMLPKTFEEAFLAKVLKFFIYVDSKELNVALQESDLLNPHSGVQFRAFLDIIHAPGNGTVSHVTLSRFKTCNSSDFLTINTFNISTGAWEKKLEYYDKYNDWNGCPMVVCATDLADRFSKEYDDVEYAHTKQLVRVIGEVYNFTPVFSQSKSDAHLFIYRSYRWLQSEFVLNNVVLSNTIFLQQES
jgi:hypothetical protein